MTKQPHSKESTPEVIAANAKMPVYHAATSEQTLALLASSLQGLNSNEAAQRRAKYGANLLPEAARQSAAKRFLLQFHNLLIYVLLGSAAATALFAVDGLRINRSGGITLVACLVRIITLISGRSWFLG